MAYGKRKILCCMKFSIDCQNSSLIIRFCQEHIEVMSLKIAPQIGEEKSLFIFNKKNNTTL